MDAIGAAVGRRSVILAAIAVIGVLACTRKADLPTLATYLEGTVTSDLDDPAAAGSGRAADTSEGFITAAVLDVPPRRVPPHPAARAFIRRQPGAPSGERSGHPG
ncbi:hypothetical protein GCM10010398_13630 [Streptomyces fimbriatus]